MHALLMQESTLHCFDNVNPKSMAFSSTWKNSDCAPTFDVIQLNTASIGHAFVIYTGRKYCMEFVLHDVISVSVATRLCCVHMHCPNF